MKTSTDVTAGESVFATAFYFIIGLLVLPFLILLRPAILLDFRGFLRSASRDGGLILLSSAKHRHRVQFKTVETDQSLEQLDAARSRMFALAQAQDWVAMGEQLEEWDRTKASCIANKRLIHPGLDGAIEALIDGRPKAKRCEPLDIACIPDELVDEAIDCFKQDTSRYGLAGLIVTMLCSQCEDLRGQMWADSVSDEAWDQIGEKYYTALWILDEAKIEERNSGLLYGERQALTYFSVEGDRAIDDWFEAVVKADPGNSAPLMAMGCLMLPRWFGDYDAIETKARQAIVWTSDEMGAAAYAILYNNALEVEATPLYFLDMELYTEAVHDLVKYRGYSPVYLPELSTLLFTLSAHPYPHGMTDPEDREIWDEKCEALRLLSLKIIEDYLPAIHPPSWINGENGALTMISRAMGQELHDGLSLIVGPRGISAHEPAEHPAV